MSGALTGKQDSGTATGTYLATRDDAGGVAVLGPLTAASHRVTLLRTRHIALLCRVAAGDPNKLIAARFGLAHQTVRNELTAAYRILGVQDRTAAVVALTIAARRVCAGGQQGVEDSREWRTARWQHYQRA